MTYKVFFVPRAGVEPARVAPLVFETSASTDSAIWAVLQTRRIAFSTTNPKTNGSFVRAIAGAKIRDFSESYKLFAKKK